MADPAAFLDLLARAELRSAGGDWAEAAALWARVTEANPVHGDYWARLAEARFAGRDFAAAAVAYQQVLELGTRPTYQVRYRADAPEFLPGEVAYMIACCQAELGRREDAIDALATALGRGFRDLDRAQADDCWQAWRDDERLRDLLGVVEVEGLSGTKAGAPTCGCSPASSSAARTRVRAVLRGRTSTPRSPAWTARSRVCPTRRSSWP
jgi:tetratricopeptide (TPR) repeat protein